MFHASEPAFGSVSAIAGELATADARSGRNRSFCSSEPNIAMPLKPIDWWTPRMIASVASISANVSKTRA